MKRILIAILLLSCAMSIKAQVGTVVNQTINTTTTTRVVEVGYTKYNRLSFSYAKYDHHIKDPWSRHGFIAEYIHGWNLMKSQPLYLESGLAFQCNFDDLYIGFDIPIEITYRYTFKNQFYVAPHAGFDLGIPVIDEEHDWYHYYDYYVDYEHNLKHFLFGYNVGLNFGRKKLNIGLGYRAGLTPTLVTEDDRKIKAGTFYVGLGINF